MTEDNLAGSRRGSWALFAACVCLIALGLGAGWLNALERHTGPGAQASLCASYRSFAAAMRSDDPWQQAARPYRTTRLAVHAAALPPDEQQDADPVPAAARGLRDQMRVPYATVRQTFEAARPVAVRCGLDWR